MYIQNFIKKGVSKFILISIQHKKKKTTRRNSIIFKTYSQRIIYFHSIPLSYVTLRYLLNE